MTQLRTPAATTVQSRPQLNLTRATDSPKESVPNAITLPSPHPASPVPPASPFAPASPEQETHPNPTLERLLSLYIDPDLTIADIAFTLFLPIARILELVKRPEFVEALKDYEIEHEKRARYLTTCNIDTAARAFVRLTTCEKPETARKAAGAIVRMHAATKPQPTPSNAQSTDRQGGGTSTRTHKHPQPPRASLPSRNAAPVANHSGGGAEAPGKPHLIRASSNEGARQRTR